ncbi:hypothetical protein GIB67_005420 [Kingdonia uniflora]|uniref:Glycosyl hydrolase family 13 catalytic domain-containing protein n=1 Tax=Kingdonia uniflora TaxID=39325 RepID=A0A7J7NI26_9MAGN|nr:hypothetical protein GIB67_005420 [Kingdonia uniflora]
MGTSGRNQVLKQDLTGNSRSDITVSASSSSPTSVYQNGPGLDASKIKEELENVATYLFRTEIGGHVKVYVGRKNMKYTVYIEVSSLPHWAEENGLILSWGIFRSDSSSLMPLSPRGSAPTTRSNTSFLQMSTSKLTVEMEFDLSKAPFYLTFLLCDAGSSKSEIRSHRETDFCVPVGIGSGHPDPLGISFANDRSVNFALFSRNAESVVLCLYDGVADKPSLEIDLDSYINRTGDIWHVLMETVEPFVSYGYRVRGKGERFDASHVLLDPYAKIICNSFFDPLGSNSLSKCLGCLSREPTFDWNGDVCPGIPMEKLMVYRLNVERFTEAKSSQLPTEVAGTFSGLIEKLHHLKSLGVNAVLLEPIFSFDVQRGPYFPSHFFSPMNFKGSTPGDNSSAINAVKEMVKDMHANGIEVLLEVAFTHTCQTMTLHEIDNSSYYLFGKDAKLEATTALNCNNPVVQGMVLNSLQHWVTEFHIDGFCFINAASLLRGPEGEYLSRPPLVEAIAFNPLLSKTKIIADCWDPYDMAPKEVTFPHWKIWAELNVKFCHNVRNFLRGEGLLSDLATRLCGSGDMFLDGRGPAFSFNYFAKNFGLPLVDLVSFSSSKLSSEISWNCGEEGPTKKKLVLERRLKQIRNYLFILYISLGVPVLNMGDECGQSSGGSVSYSDRKSFDWDALKTGFGIQITQFISFLSALRVRRSDLLQRRSFIQVENISWHGSDGAQPVWEDPSSKFLGMLLKAGVDEDGESSFDVSHTWGDLYVACNASKKPETVILPSLAEGMTWFLLIDTALPFPRFFSSDGDPVVEQIAGLVTYQLKSHSCRLKNPLIPVDAMAIWYILPSSSNLSIPQRHASFRAADAEEAEVISVIRGMRAARSVGLEKVFLLTDYIKLVITFELGSDDLS